LALTGRSNVKIRMADKGALLPSRAAEQTSASVDQRPKAAGPLSTNLGRPASNTQLLALGDVHIGDSRTPQEVPWPA
jgi:hypothetical protein